METLRTLLRSRKVLIALLAVIAKAVVIYVPNFPPEMWQSIQELAMVLIAAIAVEDFAAKIARGRSEGNG